MNRPRAEELKTILAQGRIDQAVAVVQFLDPEVAADTLMSMPYEGQQALFRRLPVEFAAKLAPIFPYYHTFVLLHSLSKSQMNAVVEKMHPIERLTFLDALPEQSWQQITNELSESQPVVSLEDLPSIPVEQKGTDRAGAPTQPIIEARGNREGVSAPRRRTDSSHRAYEFVGGARRDCRASGTVRFR